MEYRIPTAFAVGRSPKTERLYELEDQRNEIIKKAAAEWSRVTGIGDAEGVGLYRAAVPQQLFDTLEGFDSVSSMMAAMSWLIDRMEKDMHYGDDALVPAHEAGLAEMSENLCSVARKWRNLADEANSL